MRFLLFSLFVFLSCASTKRAVEYKSEFTGSASERNKIVHRLDSSKTKYWIINHKGLWEIEYEVPVVPIKDESKK